MNKLSEKGAIALRHHEGISLDWYLDPVGIPTIGIGFTFRSDSFRKWWKANKPGIEFARGAKMTRDECTSALIHLCSEEYGKYVSEFFGELLQHQFDGATSVVYNLGPVALDWKWAKALKAGNVSDSARRLKTTGTTAQGLKLRGLVIRREAEAAMIQHADYGHQPVIDAMSDGVLVRGEKGDPVRNLIIDLHTLGYYDGELDEVFGHGTQKAVLAFQEDHSIDRHGKADSQTLEAIRKAVSLKKELPSPKRTKTKAAIAVGSASATAAYIFWAEVVKLLSTIFGG
jgi:GH24 family phage-related lysozyme (muramidase)